MGFIIGLVIGVGVGYVGHPLILKLIDRLTSRF